MTKVRGALMNANITKTKKPHWCVDLAVKRDIILQMSEPKHAKDVSNNWEVTKIDSFMLNNFEHHHQPKLVCKDCTRNEARLVKELHIKLTKSRRQCNCFLPVHKERCPVAPCYHGERRWPGSDGYISVNAATSSTA